MALSVEVGLGVLRELLEAEVDEIVGPKGKWNPDRAAVRHGHEDGEVTLGGRRVGVERPRVRTADGESEVPLESYEHFAERDQLEGVVLERMLSGVSTRKYRRVQEPVGGEVEDDARSTSKSAVSRTFVQRTRELLWKLMNRPLGDLRLAVMMLDGIELHGRTNGARPVTPSPVRRRLRLLRKQGVAVDDGSGDIDELAVGGTRVVAQHLERARLVDGVAFHQDPLGALGEGTAPECALEVVVLGEAAQDDVDRALPVASVGVGDVGEHAPLRRLPDEARIGRVEQDDHRARGFPHDFLDQAEGVMGACPEPDQRHIGSLAGGHGSDVCDLNLTRDHLMPKGRDDRCDERESILALVSNQHAQMLDLAVAHERLQPSRL